MRARLPLLCLLLAACATQEAPMRTAELSEVGLRSSFDMEAAIAWRRPAGVEFVFEGIVPAPGERVQLRGWFENRTDAPQFVVVFPAGPLGFFAQPVPGSATRRPPRPGEPPRPMPAPPPPETFTLPPRARLRVECGLDPAEWDWSPGPRTIEWSLLFWNEPKPTGRVVLP